MAKDSLVNETATRILVVVGIFPLLGAIFFLGQPLVYAAMFSLGFDVGTFTWARGLVSCFCGLALLLISKFFFLAAKS